ncbi:hypothetical protein ABIE45_006320 [Methylobacterium sp. OAE515]|uniref:hypothetical protein n=1 Tax=Methylobacterium sp. OAE515 TaxID=2817895 RepID=UPI0017890591
MSPFAEFGRRARSSSLHGVLALAVGTGATAVPARADLADRGYWLAFGTPAQFCAHARAQVPIKSLGASWGMRASGVVMCRDAGRSYTFSVAYMNVRIDPLERAKLAAEEAHFDWLGLALYRSDGHGGTDWLFDVARPVSGRLRRDDTERIVFGRISFRVPKTRSRLATNMLFYLAFGQKLIAIRVL